MHYGFVFVTLSAFLMSFTKIYPQSEKCLVLGLAPCQLHQRKNYDTQPSNKFAQGQSSQQDSESALSQMCRLYEQSQQQHRK